MFCWGGSQNGQLGDGTTENRNRPVPVAGRPRFGRLKVRSSPGRTRRGGKALVRVRVRNIGGTELKGARICVKTPKRSMAVRACVKVGRIGPGKTATRKFRVRIKRTAKAGRIRMPVRATGRDVLAVRAVAVVKVR